MQQTMRRIASPALACNARRIVTAIACTVTIASLAPYSADGAPVDTITDAQETLERGLAFLKTLRVRGGWPMAYSQDFKQRWGAKALPIYELKNYSGDSKLKDSFLRDIWSYLPVSLIKILSPYFIKYKL